jgi:hypothetical protein
MFRNKTVDSVLAALVRAADDLDRLVMEQTNLAASDQEEIDRLAEQQRQRINERDRALRVGERLRALVE